jgi:catechol 2,3-dioxygenase-like lactoylglutathione lyase family enzyme
MITALHTLIYSDDPEATRAFLRDVLGWPWVAAPGETPPWPIFRAGPAEMAVHPTSGTDEGGPYKHELGHSVSLMCDDIAATRAELESRGATFRGETTDHGFGIGAEMDLPGAGTVLVYEPGHPRAHGL